MTRGTGFLASVANVSEAELVARHGADIIDLKNPSAGSLGAVNQATCCDIVQQLRAQRPASELVFSATIGDGPYEPATVATLINHTAATGVDIVKVGCFTPAPDAPLLQSLTSAAEQGIRLVVVLFAEYAIPARQLEALADCGIHGVMLDTANKTSGSLRQKLSDDELAIFIETARRQHLLAGLAGSLRRRDIGPLLGLAPDYLGFRGALCDASDRTAGLDADAVESVRLMIHSPGDSRARAS